jgi:RNase P/RNase MRP subunit p29
VSRTIAPSRSGDAQGHDAIVQVALVLLQFVVIEQYDVVTRGKQLRVICGTHKRLRVHALLLQRTQNVTAKRQILSREVQEGYHDAVRLPARALQRRHADRFEVDGQRCVQRTDDRVHIAAFIAEDADDFLVSFGPCEGPQG